MTQNEERIRTCRIKLKRSMMFRQIRNLDITDEFLLQKHYFEPLFVFVLSFISLLAKMASKLKVFQQILVVCLAAVECFVTTDEFFMEIIVTEMTFKSQVIALFSFSKSRPVTHTHQRISASHWNEESNIELNAFFRFCMDLDYSFKMWLILFKLINITCLPIISS